MTQSLFAMIVMCDLANPKFMWDSHTESLAEDILFKVKLSPNTLKLFFRFDHTDNPVQLIIVIHKKTIDNFPF